MLTINYTGKEILADHKWNDISDDIDMIKVNNGEEETEKCFLFLSMDCVKRVEY